MITILFLIHLRQVRVDGAEYVRLATLGYTATHVSSYTQQVLLHLRMIERGGTKAHRVALVVVQKIWLTAGSVSDNGRRTGIDIYIYLHRVKTKTACVSTESSITIHINRPPKKFFFGTRGIASFQLQSHYYSLARYFPCARICDRPSSVCCVSVHVSGVVRAPILLCSNSLGSRVKYVRNGYRYIRRWSEGDTAYYNTGMFLRFGWLDGWMVSV